MVKFEGCYHGHADPFLVRAGSGLATFAEPDSPGVPAATVAATRVARFNDLESAEQAIAAGDVAAVIVEPVAGNMGVVPPQPGFLDGLRSLCDRHGALLVFDEVMTGFRVAPGGAQERYGVTPDLTCLGKVVAGGTPAAAYGGPAELMRRIAPEGPVYQAGTLAGNPLVTAAGAGDLATHRRRPRSARPAGDDGSHRRSTVSAPPWPITASPGACSAVGSMITLFLGPERVTSWDEAAAVDRARFATFFHAAHERGVLLPPSPFEAWFLMDAHAATLDRAVDALVAAVGAVA